MKYKLFGGKGMVEINDSGLHYFMNLINDEKMTVT